MSVPWKARWGALLILLATVSPRIAICATPPQPLVREIREFDVLVEGKHRGSTTITIEEYPHRQTLVSTQASVSVSFVVYTYEFRFHGRELWLSDDLNRIECVTVDDGKRMTLSGTVGPTSSKLTVDGNAAVDGPNLAMTTNYWFLPSRESFDAGGNKQISIVDASTGKVRRVGIARIRSTQVLTQGRPVDCTEYRLSGDIDATLWFDATGRLVRQTCIEDGYPTELKLSRIQRTDLTTSAR